MRTFYCLLFTFYILLAGCLPAPYFQKEVALPQNAWAYNFKPSFTFEITDSAAAYQPYFLIRHTQEYPYCNLWMWVYVTTPVDTIVKKERVNITLAEASGKWLGRGMGEIYEQQMMLHFGDSIKFNRNGIYTVAMEQNMRINPLPEILDVGFRLEKTGFRTR